MEGSAGEESEGELCTLRVGTRLSEKKPCGKGQGQPNLAGDHVQGIQDTMTQNPKIQETGNQNL